MLNTIVDIVLTGGLSLRVDKFISHWHRTKQSDSERKEGRTDGQMDGRTYGPMEGRKEGRIEGRTDGWTDRWTEGRKNE